MKISNVNQQNLMFKSSQLFMKTDNQKYFLSPNYLQQGKPDDFSSLNQKSQQSENKKWQKPLLYSTLAFTALGLSLKFFKGKKVASLPSEVKKLLTKETFKVFENQTKLFPQDIQYRKDLLSAVGINPDNHLVLRSVLGHQEYGKILKDFDSSSLHYISGDSLITKAQDDFGQLKGVEEKTFRANMHMHTLYSDGKMTVLELLNQAAEYADKVALKIKNNSIIATHAPFTVAVTDHDTVEGCKEAVRIISKNPEKYKNLRVILGCELSVENKLIPQKLKSPIEMHSLLHAINPFDEKLNNLLNSKKIARIDLIKSIINKSLTKLPSEMKETALKLNYDDSKGLYPILQHGVTHVNFSTKDYIQFRTIFSECFEKNNQIQSALKQKGIDVASLNYIQPKEKFFNQINEDFGDNYWRKYQKALNKYTAELLGISEQEAESKIVVSEQMQRFFSEVQKIVLDEKPKNNLTEAFVDMEDAINLIKSSKYGFMGLAHPGLTRVGEFLENPNESMQAMSDLFKNFKEKGAQRAAFAEIHYHYFGKVGSDKDTWLDVLANYAKQAELYFSGGLDSHGKSIFYGKK